MVFEVGRREGERGRSLLRRLLQVAATANLPDLPPLWSGPLFPQRLPPTLSRQHFKQAQLLLGIIGKKTAYATLLGAVFSFTDATVENMRGKHDLTSGMVAGAVTGFLFGMGRPMPQPVAWPLAFAGAAVAADFIGELMPKYRTDFRWVVGRWGWG